MPNRSTGRWKCVLFAGGGSGGHLIPAVALAEQILQSSPECRFVFLTSPRAIDRTLLDSSGLPAAQIRIIPLPAQAAGQLLRRPWSALPGMVQACRKAVAILKQESPQCVVGLGGFASFSGVMAGRARRLPIVLLEHNVVPGRATRFLARFATRICCGLPPQDRFAQRWRDRLCVTGVPLRASISLTSREHFPPAKPDDSLPVSESGGVNSAEGVSSGEPGTLLILGGSQGSASVNRLVTSAIATLSAGSSFCSHWRIVHQSGLSDLITTQQWYDENGFSAGAFQSVQVVSLIRDVASQLVAADIVISRSGAVTVSEICCSGRTAILIPLRTAADDHQTANARWMEHHGAAIVLDESNVHAAAQLVDSLKQLLCNDRLRREMAEASHRLARPAAAADVLCHMESLLT